MPVFMTHAEHGATHVNTGEVEAHEKLGWKQDTYDNWMAPKRGKAANKYINDGEQDGIEALRIAYKEKFGKAAHHKKTAEWLQAELA